MDLVLLEKVPIDEVETRASAVVIDRCEPKVPSMAGDGEVVRGYLAGVDLMLGQRPAHQQSPRRLVVGGFQREVLGAPFIVKVKGQARLGHVNYLKLNFAPLGLTCALDLCRVS